MFLSLASGIVCMGLLSLAVFVFDPACLPHKLLPEKNASQQTWVELLKRKERLDQLEEELNRYWKSKRQVAEQVIAGQRSLAEAVEEFRSLDKSLFSASRQEQGLMVMTMSEIELSGRDVIALARRVLADHPDEAAAVADRLEKELQKLLADQKKTRSAPSDLRTEKRNH
jgi:hypothetical protein